MPTPPPTAPLRPPAPAPAPPPSPTLLLSPRYTPDSRQLRQAAEEAGWQVMRLADWRPPRRMFAGPVVLYGEPLFVDVMAAGLDLVLMDTPVNWLARLPSRFTQRPIAAMTLAEARELRGLRFIKPALAKSFPAGIYTMATQPPPGTAYLADDLPVLVAEPVDWEVEFRSFVYQRRVQTLSPYLRAGQLAMDATGQWSATDEEWQAAQAYLANILADPALDLPPAIVVDVGRIAGRGWAIIEANGAWGAGLYGCDPAAALAVVRHATHAAASASLAPADRRWARARVELDE